MFIREIKKKNKGYTKVFKYHHLVESIRTKDGPRQILIHNLGSLDLPKKDWPLLAGRIEELIKGCPGIFVSSPKIEQLAVFYSNKIIEKRSVSFKQEKDYHRIDVNQTQISGCKSIGTEYIAYSYLKRLELDKYLETCNFSQRQIEVAFLLIIGRIVNPGSELHTYHWAKENTALDELMDTDFSKLSKDILYKVSDKLHANKRGIENFLAEKERSIFNLKETIILYDLTNTYFEGRSQGIDSAKFGRSKEKRSDCRLLTLGLIIDEDGYPKASRILPGNQSEPESLSKIINQLRELNCKKDVLLLDDEPITVVMDAGIATEDNLKMLRGDESNKRIHYIAVSRHKPDEYVDEDAELLTVREGKNKKVEVKIVQGDKIKDKDTFLYCKSDAKQRKEEGMRNKFIELIEQGLENISRGLTRKGGTKRFDKVCERVGRIRQKYPIISSYYKIDVIPSKKKKGYAENIKWEYIKKEQSDLKFSGRYYLRTDRTDLDEKEIFDIYVMLTRLENVFRHLKSDLRLRPNHHQKEHRAKGHIFITVLAYHVLNSILNRLQTCDYSISLSRIKRILSTHMRCTTELTTDKNETIYIRKCSRPNYNQKQIYSMLQLGETPISSKKYIS